MELHQLDCNPTVSTPLNVDKLALELVNHPNSSFVSNLINALRYGTGIGYLGPHKSRVSRNLISASQHPDVISGNLHKEVQLGRIGGPFSSPPLPDLQCHPIGVVPKKHSVEWHTIYHLSYPEGDSINDYISKDPYSLQYVCVDDAIVILRSLGTGSFMAKTDLKSAFHLMPIHPEDWNLLGIYWQSQYYIDLYLCLAILYPLLYLVRSSLCCAGEIRKALPILLFYSHVSGRISEAFGFVHLA